MSGVLDSHVHFYPKEVSANPEAWGAAHQEHWWTSCVAPKNRTSIQGWADPARLLRDMDLAGVEKALLLGWYWENQETCEIQNEWYLDCVREHPDRLAAFATVQPNSGQRGLDALERALDAGLLGIGELHPQVQNFSFGDPAWHRVTEIASRRQIPINLHVTDPLVPTKGPVRATPLQEFIRLGHDHPGLIFILAHWGGGLPFYELNPKIASDLKNFYYDTSASPLLYHPRIFRGVIDLIGPDRILFGSDYPLLLYPKESREPGFERLLQDLAALDLSENERSKIFSRNLTRLLDFGRK